MGRPRLQLLPPPQKKRKLTSEGFKVGCGAPNQTGKIPCAQHLRHRGAQGPVEDTNEAREGILLVSASYLEPTPTDRGATDAQRKT